jgi:hypothetical protein
MALTKALAMVVNFLDSGLRRNDETLGFIL